MRQNRNTEEKIKKRKKNTPNFFKWTTDCKELILDFYH